MIQNKENVSSAQGQHRPPKAGAGKAVLSKKQKKLCIAAGGALLLLSAASLVYWLFPAKESVENTLYSYEVTADSSYRVHVIPNELYDNAWLDEGGVYPEALTDYIELNVKASLQGSAAAETSGSYQVKAVLEGYQNAAEKRQIIYEKQFPLKDGEITQTEDGQTAIEETLQIPLAPYRQQAARAEQILQTSVARDLYVDFTGKFTVDTAFGKKEQDFTYQVTLPIGTGTSIFGITKPQPFSKDGQITETKEIAKPVRFQNILLSALAAAAGCALLLFAFFFTRQPDEEEAWQTRMRSILRKYGSRMTRLERLPECGTKECIYVADIDSMVAMAEELRQPVFYSPDAEQLPRDGAFCISGPDRLYLYQVQRPHTTLVVDADAKGGK